MSRRVASHLGGFVDLVAEPIDETPAVGISQSIVRLVIGRHLRIAEHVINFPPTLDVVTGQQIGIQLVHLQPSLGLVRSMTRQTMLLQNRRDELSIVRQIRLEGFLGISWLRRLLGQEPRLFPADVPKLIETQRMWVNVRSESRVEIRNSNDEGDSEPIAQNATSFQASLFGQAVRVGGRS